MFNLNARILSALAATSGILASPAAVSATVLGPHAQVCEASADHPAILVRINGLSRREGMLHVQTYGGNPDMWFEKGAYLERVDVAPPANGSIEVCMPVPHAGTYAVLVKHDLGGGTFGLNNGGGFSGNPSVSALDVIMKRKPTPDRVQVSVKGLTPVPITMRYMQGSL